MPARPSPASSSSVASSIAVGPVPAPGVRDHAHAARLLDHAQHLHQRRGVPVDVGRHAGVEVALERLVPVADHAERDQGVGDVRPAGRGGPVRGPAHVGGADRDAQLAQLLQDRRHPGAPPVEDLVELLDERRVGRVGQVGQQVDPLALVLGADLDPAHQRQADLLGRSGRLGPALGRVVVGQPQHVQPGRHRRVHQLRRALRPVAAPRVGVEVDPHP